MQPTPPLQSSPALAIVLILSAGIILAGMDATAKYLSLELPILIIIWGRYFFHTVITFFIYAGR
ncbi:MAG: hypothetical protein ISR53_01090, partial [Rhodospirillales bacterium]|nr:hypothetical protein [Rhodospirillales bacterium]